MKKIIAFLYILAMSSSHAQTIETVVNGMIPQVKNIPQIIYIISYLAGVVFGIKAALKFKEANESRGQVKISVAIIYIIAAGLFLTLPTLINSGIEFMGFDSPGQFKY